MRRLGFHAESLRPEPKAPKDGAVPLAGHPGPDHEPEGFGEAVAAAGLMLGLVTSAAFLGFAWDRYDRRSAHAYAISLIERMAIDGAAAAMPPWSGPGRGPDAPTAKATFAAVRRLGGFAPHQTGGCTAASSFAICSGTRYRCQISGTTPAGPIAATIGLCDDNRGAAWSIDLVDVTVPQNAVDRGNRAEVDLVRDGPIRYGDTPPAPDPMPTKIRGLRLVRPGG